MIENAYQEEEAFWKAKSKNTWLQVGDKNTRVFHGWVETRRMKNRVQSLLNENGVEHYEEEQKGEIAVQYFQNLFSSSGSQNADRLLEGMLPRVTDRMNSGLIKPVTEAEIKRAVKAIKSDSAPGIDGMTGQFFQKYWSVTGAQVTKEVKGFFETGVVTNAKKMQDLRPISLCSVVYKIISKVLSNRLKLILPKIVSPTQGAFVAGRLISDNLLIAHEMIHGLKTNPNCKEDFIAIKTDMSKAYDRVEWDFLETLFLKTGFDRKWIDWVMNCIRSVTYTVLMNGESFGHITPERGIRQGDPLSPFLFILCAEALVHVMNRAEQNDLLTGMKLTRNCPSIQHLLFADDSLFLCRASLRECTEFLKCLKLYEDSSGQIINFQKSAITFGAAIDPTMKRLLAEILHIDNEGGDGKYLGLPECFSGSKQQLVAFIGEKLNKRLRGWFAKKLSLGGKEVLLKSIAMALPVYAMSCFRLTKHHCQKIMSAMASFWWDEDGEKKKIHWIAWKKVCVPKDQGGLGFRDIEDFNQALLAKQAWKLYNEPESLLAKVYKGRYYASSNILECGKGYRPSYAWRSILFGRELLLKGLIRSIGDGKETLVWGDKWILDEVPRRPVNKQLLYDVKLRVDELIGNDGKWRIETLTELFPPNDAERIKQMAIGGVQDRYVWAYTKSEGYTVKSGSWLATKSQIGNRGREDEPAVLAFKKKIWKLPTLPKIRMFLWRAVSGALAVAERLTAHGMPVDTICKLCQQGEETIAHVLFHCTKARDLWREFHIAPEQQFPDLSLVELLESCLKLMQEGALSKERRQALPWMLWAIWKNMNSLLYAETQESIAVLMRRALEEASLWYEVNKGVSGEEQTALHMGVLQSWTPPAQGMIKCNFHANWRSDRYHVGGAWITRNYNGEVGMHARDALTPNSDKLSADMYCLLWVLKSLRDLRIEEVHIGTDSQELYDAIQKPYRWPRYRGLLQQITTICSEFVGIEFEVESVQSNKVAREISRSVLRDGCFQSYLAMGGPSWLHNIIKTEGAMVIS
ncbi:uncharacterized protein LOC108858692 [Raphanus sativus]|uniref:Uncharacterized protein LOC108858692 n=1 Tax=Raphanus sativus TaxID=3726 RepID=A0A6J0NTS0_RAPSA|nr:uncharacterized protein LOC108858692 [Raphanus sativus]